MRIITGKYKGKVLKAPAGIRPTEDRVRKAFFDMVDVEGCQFLELFAGSGAIGFEALSRGAAEVTFVEKDAKNAAVIRQNLRGLAEAEVLDMDALDAVGFLFKKGRKFDIIFLDPPYSSGMAENTLQSLGAYDILQSSGFVCVQHFKKNILPQALGSLKFWRKAGYGDTLLSFYKRTEHDDR